VGATGLDADGAAGSCDTGRGTLGERQMNGKRRGGSEVTDGQVRAGGSTLFVPVVAPAAVPGGLLPIGSPPGSRLHFLGGELLMDYSQPQTGRAVVPLPAEVDVTNARQAGRELLAAFVPGVTAVIADMTATTFCDSSGVRMLALVYELAGADQAKLILVVPSAGVLRILSLTRLD
jgi:anti-sigma B factor antagonist